MGAFLLQHGQLGRQNDDDMVLFQMTHSSHGSSRLLIQNNTHYNVTLTLMTELATAKLASYPCSHHGQQQNNTTTVITFDTGKSVDRELATGKGERSRQMKYTCVVRLDLRAKAKLC